MRQMFLVLFFLLSAAASAAPVTWTLNDVLFNDGATATGSFDYDASTGSYSAINIVTTASQNWTGETYTNQWSGSSDQYFTMTGITSTFNILRLEYIAPLTASGGVINLQLGEPQFGSLESDSIDFRYISAGTVSAVPVPAAVWLFGSALAGLGWMRRKQTV